LEGARLNDLIIHARPSGRGCQKKKKGGINVSQGMAEIRGGCKENRNRRKTGRGKGERRGNGKKKNEKGRMARSSKGRIQRSPRKKGDAPRNKRRKNRPPGAKRRHLLDWKGEKKEGKVDVRRGEGLKWEG